MSLLCEGDKDRSVDRRRRRAAAFVPAALVALVLFGLVAGMARARGPATLVGETGSPASAPFVPVHGDADWIRRGGYQDRDGDHCCGVHDCFRLSPAEVREGPDGFALLGRFIPHAEARPSEDGHYWACYSLFKFRCFFYPAQRF